MPSCTFRPARVRSSGRAAQSWQRGQWALISCWPAWPESTYGLRFSEGGERRHQNLLGKLARSVRYDTSKYGIIRYFIAANSELRPD